MELPDTEKQLRLLAANALEKFLDTLPKEAVAAERLPIYSIFDIKCAGIYIAREAIRQFCPHLANSADDNLDKQFAEGEDKPL